MVKRTLFGYFSEPGTRAFLGFGEYFEGTPQDVPLASLLELNTRDLKQFTKNLLESKELSKDTQALLSELSRGISAIFQFQDILDVSLDEEGSPIFGRHHCYYESLIYLRESAVSWLDRNVLAALTLLRPFLELSVLHLYWYLRCRTDTYKPFYDWLTHYGSDRGRPSFRATLDYVFENVPTKGWVDERRAQELKQVFRNLYRSLCSYHHAPKMDESVAAESGGFGSISLESFFYYLHTANILLHQIVYLYILSYPMSLFPVDRHEKWGFEGGPVGLFFDKVNYGRLEAYVGKENCSNLRQSLRQVPDVVSLTTWFDSLPNLSQEELDMDWERIQRENPSLKETHSTDLRHRLAIMRAFKRSEAWALNYILEQTRDRGIPDDLSETLRRRLRNW